MESTIGQRIRKLREAKQLSVTDFAKAAGVKPSAIYGLEGDANKPSIETVGTLRQSFPDLNTEWLQFGVGAMFKDDKELTPLSQLQPPVPSEAKPAREGLPAIPGTATPKEADFVGRLISQLEAENARKDALIEWLQDQNAQLLKKPSANVESAGYMFAERTEISLRPTACQPVYTEAVVRPMWPEVEQAQKAA